MAEPKPTAEVKVSAPVKEVQKPKWIRAIYGRMVDPFTKVTYDTIPIEYHAPSGWVASQLEASKMEMVV